MTGKLSPGFADAVGDAQSCFRLVLDAMTHPGRLHTVRPLSPPPPLCDAAAAVVLTLVDQETPLWLDPDAAAARAWVAFHTGAPVVEEPARAIFAVALSLPAASFPVSPFPVQAAPAPAFSVMPGVGPASTPSGADGGKGVDGKPAPAMTSVGASAPDGAPTRAVPLGADPLADTMPDPVAPPTSPALSIGTDEAPETSASLILQVVSLTTGRRYRLQGPGLRKPAILTVEGLPADFATIWQRNYALFPCGIDLILCAGNQLAALPRSVSVREA
jgi:alpha-D-ribose 1-methylphosphonate 5-triphosphate synthase subunit PhnH